MSTYTKNANYYMAEVRHLHDNAGSYDLAKDYLLKLEECYGKAARSKKFFGEAPLLRSMVEDARKIVEEMKPPKG